MKFSAGVVAAITPMAALAFMQPGTLKHAVPKTELSKGSFGEFKTKDDLAQRNIVGALNMAFKLKEGETSNMFDGPTPLTKERDACGVGFIANTKEGGEGSYVSKNWCN